MPLCRSMKLVKIKVGHVGDFGGANPHFRRWRLQAEVTCSPFGAPVPDTQVLKCGDDMSTVSTLSVLVLLSKEV